jgi:AAA+ superfamily predicted ATPase
MESENIFDDVITFPDPNAANRFAALVGLDLAKERLIKEARLLLNPKLLDDWSKQHYGESIPLLQHFRNRASLFVLGGDVGTGKSSLAESLGDPIARQEKISVTLYRLSLNARGGGTVGEMTRLLTHAFKEVREVAAKGKSSKGRCSSAVILLIDEADALAQSRENAQMHHEDRAGVNALIRGIDSLAARHLPVLVIMCTNRLDAIDPAVRRRATAIFEFSRPDNVQRIAVLTSGLAGVGLTKEEIDELAIATGPTDTRVFGCTYSDMIRRLLPDLLLDAFPNQPIEFARALTIARALQPTPPFRDQDSDGVANQESL